MLPWTLRSHPHARAYLALAAVCLFWGTTYLGIRMALEGLPPLTLVCIRYILSGGILLAAAFFSGAHLPTGRELVFTALFGLMILGAGNGCLVFAELLIPSGTAALFVTTSPFWMVGIEALLPGGERLHLPTVMGMLAGFAGALLLITPGVAMHGFGGPVLKAFLLLQVGCSSWSLGSILQRRYQTRAHAVVGGAVQQLATGLVFLAPALLVKTAPLRWSARSAGALLYLVVFGSLVGYSAYVYALERLPVSVVSLYNYICPIVAVLLGWLFYREPVGWREGVAMLIIFAGVTLVKRSSGSRRAAAA